MALHDQFAALTTGTVTHKPFAGINDYGAPSYSTAASTYAAYYEPSQRLVRTEDGREVTARGRVYVISTGATIRVNDYLALNGSTTPLTMLNVNTLNDLDGQHHIEVDV